MILAVALAPAGAAASEHEFPLTVTHGETATEDDGVVALTSGGRVVCTGVLLSDRVIATAGHCIGHIEEVYFGEDLAAPGERIRLADQMVHEDFEFLGLSADLGAVVLAEPAPAFTTPAVFSSVVPDAGDFVRVVGFGVQDPENGDEGIKRQGSARVSEIEEDKLLLAPSPSQPCAGDSGGPVFYKEDGGETLVGITSSGDRECVSFAHVTRLDIYWPFLERVVEEATAWDRSPDSMSDRVSGGCAIDDSPANLTGIVFVLLVVGVFARPKKAALTKWRRPGSACGSRSARPNYCVP